VLTRTFRRRQGELEQLPLRRGKNHLEARILHSLYAYNSHYAALGAIWWWPKDSRVCVMDIDGTVTISDKRGLLASSFMGAAKALGSALKGRGGGGGGGSSSAGQAALPSTTGSGAGGGAEGGAGAPKGFVEALSHGYVHAGVGEALSHMAQHGCCILYLTARPITLAHKTREFLFLQLGSGCECACVGAC